jgi:hypothetical protein
MKDIDPDNVAQDDVKRAYPAWRTWKGNDNLFHGQRSTPGAALSATGESWDDLIDEIRRSESKLDGIRATLTLDDARAKTARGDDPTGWI